MNYENDKCVISVVEHINNDIMNRNDVNTIIKFVFKPLFVGRTIFRYSLPINSHH